MYRLLQELHLDKGRVQCHLRLSAAQRQQLFFNILHVHVSVTFVTRIGCLGAATAMSLKKFHYFKLSVDTCHATDLSLEMLDVHIFLLNLYVFLSRLV